MSNDGTQTTTPCAGCGAMKRPEELMTFHLRSVGDIPTCSDECATKALARLREERSKPDDDLTVNEAGVFRQVIVDALHVHGQETPADIMRRIEPGGYDRMARRITRPWQPPTERDLNDAACYIACQAAEIERLRAENENLKRPFPAYPATVAQNAGR